MEHYVSACKHELILTLQARLVRGVQRFWSRTLISLAHPA